MTCNDSPSLTYWASIQGFTVITRLLFGDWILVSASTSGSLGDALVQRGAAAYNIATLFYLKSTPSSEVPKGTVCDLTSHRGNNSGYPPIDNYRPDHCPFCKKGYILAELEGDQFLFQKRETLRIRIRKNSQNDLAREIVEKLTRKEILKLRLQPSQGDASYLDISGDELLQDVDTRALFMRQVRRFSPSPLKYVVLDDVSESSARVLLRDGEVLLSDDVKFVHWSTLGNVDPVPAGGALVLFGLLHDHARARQINATLRRIVPKGAVTYLSALTIAETPDDLADLKIFLEYGEHGRDTFIFRSIYELAFPRNVSRSAWTEEYELLAEVCQESSPPTVLQDRLNFLNGNSITNSQIFLTRPSANLSINNDFVYLNVDDNHERISQADIVCVVANALASARCRDLPIHGGRDKNGDSRLQSSLYGHALLCPQNFRNYNDSILRATLLRLARPSELAYAVDEACSQEMLELIMDEIDAWKQGTGDALPEFLLALASERLSLDERHLVKLRDTIDVEQFPNYLQVLIKRFMQ